MIAFERAFRRTLHQFNDFIRASVQIDFAYDWFWRTHNNGDCIVRIRVESRNDQMPYEMPFSIASLCSFRALTHDNTNTSLKKPLRRPCSVMTPLTICPPQRKEKLTIIIICRLMWLATIDPLVMAVVCRLAWMPTQKCVMMYGIVYNGYAIESGRHWAQWNFENVMDHGPHSRHRRMMETDRASEKE